jgi:hypothetical protein
VFLVMFLPTVFLVSTSTHNFFLENINLLGLSDGQRFLLVFYDDDLHLPNYNIVLRPRLLTRPPESKFFGIS